MITQAKQKALREAMEALEIEEKDIRETFTKGGGKGGQKQNKTASLVQLSYPPLNITIQCQKTRSLADNRFFARRTLVKRVEEQTMGKNSPSHQQQEKARKQKKRRQRRRTNSDAT